jgi:hypothetical protein
LGNGYRLTDIGRAGGIPDGIAGLAIRLVRLKSLLRIRLAWLVDWLQGLEVAQVVVFQRMPISLGCKADNSIALVLVSLDLH